jgi:hypothetical protein
MLFRFQLTAQTLTSMLRGRFQRQDLCVPDPIVPDPVNPTYIDHIEFADEAVLGANILQSGSAISVSLPTAAQGSIALTPPTFVLNRAVDIYTTTLSDLKAANGGAPAVVRNPLTLQLALSVVHSTAVVSGKTVLQDQLLIAYYGINFAGASLGGLGASAAQVDAKLRALLPPVASPLDFSSAFTSLAGSGFSPVSVWSGIAASSDFSLAEIRVEFSAGGAAGVADPTAWSAFYNNQGVDNILNGQDWAFFIDKDLLLGIVSSLVTPAVQTSDSFRLESGPTFSWNSGTPGVIAQFSGAAIDACQCAWGKIDVGESLTLDVDFSQNDGFLRIDLHLQNSSNQLDILCCELTPTLLWPFVGLSSTPTTVIGRLEYIVGLIFPIGVFVYAIYQASEKVPSLPGLEGFQTDPNDAAHLFSDVSVTQALDSADGTFDLQVATGVDPGLILAGTFTDKLLKPAVIQTTDEPFAWYGGAVTCSGSIGTWTAQASVQITRASGDLDFSLCRTTVYPDSWSADLSTSTTYNPYAATVTLSTPTYVAGSASLFIQTTGGLRYVTFGPMPELTQQDIDRKNRLDEAWRLEHCYVLQAPWARYGLRFNVKWSIDPAIGQRGQVEQIWTTVMAGLNARDRIVATEPDGKEIQTAYADAAGAIRMNFAANLQSIDMGRYPFAKDSATDSGKPISTQKQTLLEEVATIPVGDTVLAMQGIPGRFSTGLLVALREILYEFAIDARGSWSCKNSWRGLDLVGALSTDGRMFGWNALGELTDLSAIATKSSLVSSVSSARLTTNGTHVPTHAAFLGAQRLGLNDGTLRSLDTGAPLNVPADATSLSRVGTASFLLGTSRGGYELYSRAPLVGFELSAKFAKQPWFDGITNLDPWTIVLSENRTRVRILSILAQQTL